MTVEYNSKIVVDSLFVICGAYNLGVYQGSLSPKNRRKKSIKFARFYWLSIIEKL